MSSISGVELLRIAGHTKEEQPFVAFAARLDRRLVRLAFEWAPTRKTMTQFVADTNALCGLNGGFYTLDRGHPLDWLVIDGSTVTELTNTARPCISLNDTSALIHYPNAGHTTGHVLQAGPLLVQNGVVVRDYSDFREKAAQFDADITAQRHPRSVFGISPDHYLMLAIDGRSSVSVGLFLDECGELAAQLGAIDAINLDGGGSSMLVVENRLINNPRTWPNQPEPAERPIPTAILAHRL